MLATLDKWTTDPDSADYFFSRILQQKVQQRLRGQFDRQVNDQVKAIEQTKVTVKKRTGVAQFIKYFPVFVSRIESQLAGADAYETRRMVDAAYDRLVNAMLDCLKAMAKLEGADDDKGQLNHHVILIGTHLQSSLLVLLMPGSREHVLLHPRAEPATARFRAGFHPESRRDL